MDEFDSIARLFRPLATSPEALGLMDDAAVLPSRPGYDLVITTDTMIEGVHFMPDDAPDLIARKLLRVNLSDLAAKGAEPYGYLLNTAWAPGWDATRRAAFARGLAQDQAAFGLKLFGGDTVATPGPLNIGATLFGWVPVGRMARRGGARAGDILLVSGTIGDGSLGLRAARGELTGEGAAWLADRYRLPQPRLSLRDALLAHASAAADVSDGLLADAGHIGEASGLGVKVALERIPVSDATRLHFPIPLIPAEAGTQLEPEHLAGQTWVPAFAGMSGWEGFLELATSGDDYEIVCTAAPSNASALIAAADAVGIAVTVIGQMVEGQGVSATFHGQPVPLDRLGWRHG